MQPLDWNCSQWKLETIIVQMNVNLLIKYLQVFSMLTWSSNCCLNYTENKSIYNTSVLTGRTETSNNLSTSLVSWHECLNESKTQFQLRHFLKLFKFYSPTASLVCYTLGWRNRKDKQGKNALSMANNAIGRWGICFYTAITFTMLLHVTLKLTVLAFLIEHRTYYVSFVVFVPTGNTWEREWKASGFATKEEVRPRHRFVLFIFRFLEQNPPGVARDSLN